KNIQIIGNCIGKTADLEKAIQDYSNNQLSVVVDSVYKDGDVANFFEKSFNAKDRFGKVVYLY
ncbi:MAG: zinc-binding alcohol dehydrogenase family protein, partial [Bacteroidota bacterium]